MKNQQILVIGSINVDHIMRVKGLPKPGETVAGGHYDIVGGGKGANQAVACARLGGQTTFIANIGKDAFGKSLVKQFAKDRVDTSLIKVVSSESTGVALIFVDDEAENAIGIAAGANDTLSPEQIRCHENAIARADFILIQLEVPLETIIEAATLAKKNDTKVVLNPAPAKTLPASLLRCVDIITPNQTEAEILTGINVVDEKTAAAAARIIHKNDVATVLITMGKDGVYVSIAGDGSFVTGFDVVAVDTTAAGDVFNGAFLVGLASGLEVTDAVKFANQCAAISVTRAGAQTSIPYIAEVEKLAGRPLFLREETAG